jgi:hypothetical protein
VFFARSAPMVAHATLGTTTEDVRFLRVPCRNVISRIVSKMAVQINAELVGKLVS